MVSACFAVGCGSDPPRSGATTAGGVGTLGDGGSSQGTDGGGEATAVAEGDSSSGAEPGEKFDVGAAGDETGPPLEEGCTQVDFLFVIDNSDSMSNKQAQLVGAFPGFMETIQNTLSAQSDYHILVTDTDAWGKCTPGNCDGGECNDPVAGKYICMTDFEVCDETRGAGVVHPAGRFATNAPCTLFGGNRYIVEGEADLAGTFECIATVGTAGDGAERPMDGMVAALDPAINGPGGCNDGFLRDDAILVITFISDDPWNEDSGDPDAWYEAVVDAKNGDADSVVVLGLTPAWDGCRDGDGPPKGEHWKTFIELWGDRGLHGNVCGTADEYVAFFEEAVAAIDATCEANPPG